MTQPLKTVQEVLIQAPVLRLCSQHCSYKVLYYSGM